MPTSTISSETLAHHIRVGEERARTENASPIGGWPNIAFIEERKTLSRDHLVTPTMAQQARTYWKFARQRKMRMKWIKMIADAMAENTYEADATICVLPTSEKILTNGNHTFEGIIQHGAPYSVSVKYRFCQDMQEVEAVYMRTDAGRNRTPADVLRAHLGDVSHFRLKEQALSGTNYILRKFGGVSGVPAMPEERVAFMDGYMDAIERLDAILTRAPKASVSVIKIAAVMAVALETMRYSIAPEIAVEFWTKVANDNGLLQGDPAKLLLTFVTNMRIKNKGGGGPSGGQRAIQIARYTIAAWNHHTRHYNNEGYYVKFLKPQNRGQIILQNCTGEYGTHEN